MVMAADSIGMPARNEQMRATFMALLGLRHGTADDDVFDFFSVQIGDALERALDGGGAEVVGAGRAQRAFGGFADRRCERH